MAADTPAGRVRALVELLEQYAADFDAERSDLSRLVRDVESVVDALSGVVDDGWVTDLRGLWGDLEIIYALMLDEGRTLLSDDERRDVADVLSAMRSVLKPQSDR